MLRRRSELIADHLVIVASDARPFAVPGAFVMHPLVSVVRVDADLDLRAVVDDGGDLLLRRSVKDERSPVEGMRLLTMCRDAHSADIEDGRDRDEHIQKRRPESGVDDGRMDAPPRSVK